MRGCRRLAAWRRGLVRLAHDGPMGDRLMLVQKMRRGRLEGLKTTPHRSRPAALRSLR